MRGDRITELGLFRIEPSGEITEYSQLFQPGVRLSPAIVALTGITDEMLADQPAFTDCIDAWKPLVQGAVIIGHNVRFDLQFLFAECFRAGQDMEQVFGKTIVLDTVQLARRVFGQGGNALQKLSARLGIAVTGAHRALADCQTTWGVLTHLLAALRQTREPAALTLLDVIQAQGGAVALVSENWRGRATTLALSTAALRGELIRLIYQDGRSSSLPSERVVRPLSIRRGGQTGGGVGQVLLAHCHLRNETRAFRLDRIVSFAVVSESASFEPDVSQLPPSD